MPQSLPITRTTTAEPVVLVGASGEVGGGAYSAEVSHTRPANTTAYTAGDVVGNASGTGAIEFTSMGPSGGRVLLTTASLRVNVASIPSGMTSFRLHLYNVTPPSALADNDAWNLPAGDRASYLGYVDLGSPADFGDTLYTEVNQLNKQVKLLGTSLFGYLVTNGGYTPTSGATKVNTLAAVGL